MIIGTGDIAQVLTSIDTDDRIYFASGVSNSAETRPSEFQRERTLLYQQDARHLVYFSSLSVFYSDTPYAQHKRHMEQCVRSRQRLWAPYTIVRIGNIAWGSNPHTLINHLRQQRQQGNLLDVQDVWRYVIEQDEFLHWMRLIPSWSCEMNLPGRQLKVADIVRHYVDPYVSVEVAA